jgi:hypothetical protein
MWPPIMSTSPSSAMRTDEPGIGRPTLPISRFAGVLTVAPPVVSVRP